VPLNLNEVFLVFVLLHVGINLPRKEVLQLCNQLTQNLNLYTRF